MAVVTCFAELGAVVVHNPQSTAECQEPPQGIFRAGRRLISSEVTWRRILYPGAFQFPLQELWRSP